MADGVRDIPMSTVLLRPKGKTWSGPDEAVKKRRKKSNPCLHAYTNPAYHTVAATPPQQAVQSHLHVRMTEVYEVAVLGAGVMGSATAYYLASRGTRPVLLLEQVRRRHD